MNRSREEMLALAERLGWHNVADFGYGLQPIARYVGDGLGPLPRTLARENDRG